MDKFWEWMKEKNYKGSFREKSLSLMDRGWTYPSKQMLIGYMIEYLVEHGNNVILTSCQNIEGIYDFYERQINKIELEDLNNG
jgi:hypothetical protein